MSEEVSLWKVLRNGRQLELGDLSQWEIDIGDSTKTLIWTPTARLKIDEVEDDKLFPHRITNLDTSEPDVVRARCVFGR